MNLSRRHFIWATGGTTLLSLPGCQQAESFFNPRSAFHTSSFPSSLIQEHPSFFQARHFLNRISFGPRFTDYDNLINRDPDTQEAASLYLEEQLHPETIDDRKLDRVIRRFENLQAPLGELYEYEERFLIEDLAHATLLRAVYSEKQLYEVMVQFWTDHFNISPFKGECLWLKPWDDREVIRKHALKTFPELLRASALSPAMLWYLDGRSNQKKKKTDAPNENYARELLELHTLGVNGGYSQNDVMEVARCFTGWTTRARSRWFKGQIEFVNKWHDDGPKEVLGHRIPAGGGKKDIDDVLHIVALHPSTATYLSTKLCQRFINDNPSQSVIQDVAQSFLNSKGDIKSTLRTLFQSKAFWESKHQKFKRPFEFVVSALRATQAETFSEKVVIKYLTRMGHVPFEYPTPDGYPIHQSPWTSTLLWRWNFAATLSHNKKKFRSHPYFIKNNAKAFAPHFMGTSTSPHSTDSTPQHQLALMLASPEFQYC